VKQFGKKKKMKPTNMPEATREIWEETERGFYEEWDFPNSSGSIDGKHVTL
jgi:hypothetical protein